MSAHTPEPWKVFAHAPASIWVGETPVATCKTQDTQSPLDDIPWETASANAARIVACVNACRGVELDQLEALAKLERNNIAGIGMLAVDHMLVRKQRSELAAILRDMLALRESGATPVVLAKKARAALEKVTT